MADKDMTEWDVLTKKLPQADILICLYHTLKSFRGEISIEKMETSVGERDPRQDGTCKDRGGIPGPTTVCT